jgi:hypothetical protein
MYVLNYIWQEWIWEGKKILFSEWDVGDEVSLGPNQEQHRDYLDWASAVHGGGADACHKKEQVNYSNERCKSLNWEGALVHLDVCSGSSAE